ncbi:hypothetical protein B0H19DRAFT_1274728 [Mycena capillaripes]|nr:hypothetical protein B0H19DRAFT_1274728 [Mycena capillaripes]
MITREATLVSNSTNAQGTSFRNASLLGRTVFCSFCLHTRTLNALGVRLQFGWISAPHDAHKAQEHYSPDPLRPANLGLHTRLLPALGILPSPPSSTPSPSPYPAPEPGRRQTHDRTRSPPSQYAHAHANIHAPHLSITPHPCTSSPSAAQTQDRTNSSAVSGMHICTHPEHHLGLAQGSRAIAAAHGALHASAVPLTAQRLAPSPCGHLH